MASNHKLTGVIKGRTIKTIENQADTAKISFDDGSSMSINIAQPIATSDIGKRIKAVRQSGTTLDLDFDDASTLEITTSEATSSVMIRDKNHTMEYAD